MSGKRFVGDSRSGGGGTDNDDGEADEKRLRTVAVPHLEETATVHSLLATMEPLLRKVVKEEVERWQVQHALCLRCCRTSQQQPSISSESCDQYLRLAFNTKLSLPIFTGTRISGPNNTPIEIHLLGPGPAHNHNSSGNHKDAPVAVRIELVVIDGDFPAAGSGSEWSAEEFEKSIVKERSGKRPLLSGERLSSITGRDGVAVMGDIAFTDNSSWIRSRMFRIGARIVGHPSCIPGIIRIKEAITEAFVVKDHRGESYKKHHPPMLEDEVWRLEKIGKNGVLHKKLADAGIHTVQDFLRLSVVHPATLRLQILGAGMTNKMWEATMKHAKTCVLSRELYIYRGHDFVIYLNPICQLLKAVVKGQLLYPNSTTTTTVNRAYVENLAREAYANWKSLQKVEVEGVINGHVPLLTHPTSDIVEQYPDSDLVAREMEEGAGDHAYNNIRERHQNTATEYGEGCVWHPTSVGDYGI